MGYEENGRTQAEEHRLVMDRREALELTGVQELESFDEAEVVVQTTQGRLVISGDSLHVGRLDLAHGKLQMDGLVTALRYEESVPGGSLWSRLFR